MLLFSYQIVPRGGQTEHALVTRNLYVSDVESAKRYVRTVTMPDLPAISELEVILRDKLGLEIWRGPYLGTE